MICLAWCVTLIDVQHKFDFFVVFAKLANNHDSADFGKFLRLVVTLISGCCFFGCYDEIEICEFKNEKESNVKVCFHLRIR